jgi:hypothetical protein
MVIRKKVELDEYTVKVVYNKLDGSLIVSVYDEIDELIEEISITNDEGDGGEMDDDIDISLN